MRKIWKWLLPFVLIGAAMCMHMPANTPPVASSYIDVDNSGWYNVTVYITHEGSSTKWRVGEVFPFSKARLTIPKGLLNDSNSNLLITTPSGQSWNFGEMEFVPLSGGILVKLTVLNELEASHYEVCRLDFSGACG